MLRFAKVTGRAGKTTGQYKFWFNIVDDSGLQKCIDLEDNDLWKKIEEVNLVLIPRKRHNEPECLAAKQVELQKLRDFDTFVEVEDTGQSRISTTWVLWWKGTEVRARLPDGSKRKEGSGRIHPV